MKRWVYFAPLAVLAIILGFYLSRLNSPKPEGRAFESPPRAAPMVVMKGFDGPDVDMASFKGRPVLVNFWGSYCAPCKVEHPLLIEMAKEGVEILGILYHDPEPEEARTYLARAGNPFAAIGVDYPGEVFVGFGAAGVPESFLLDANGQIVKSHRSNFTPESARAFIDAYKAEKAKAGAPKP
jgi:cytochrome c biogenesis protein CcmG/thiol:disulfide interchange protein DsbE